MKSVQGLPHLEIKGLIPRPVDIANLWRLVQSFPVTILVGPRRCGKTTISKQMEPNVYFDISHSDIVRPHKKFSEVLLNQKGLVVIDEIHLSPGLFSTIKKIVDKQTNRKFLVLGSSSKEVLENARRELIGRSAVYRLSGFSIRDVGEKYTDVLWCRGGFPNSFLAENDTASVILRDSILQGILNYDVYRHRFIEPYKYNAFLLSITKQHGNILNYSKLAYDLDQSINTLKRYLAILEELSIVFLFDPWSEENLKKKRKHSKLCVSDSGIANNLMSIKNIEQLHNHKMVGLLWEGFVSGLMARVISQNGGIPSYWHSNYGSSIDFVWRQDGYNWGIEIIYGVNPKNIDTLGKNIERLQLKHLWIIYRGNQVQKITDNITAVPLIYAESIPEKIRNQEIEFLTKSINKVHSVEPQKMVFISYRRHRRDSHFVKKLCSTLKAARINVIIDEECLKFGDNIRGFIKKAIKDTDFTIQVISKNSLRSPWIMLEFLQTIRFEHTEHRKKYIPITIDAEISDPKISGKIIRHIDHELIPWVQNISNALEQKESIEDDYNSYKQLIDFRKNVKGQIATIRSMFVGNFTTPKHFNKSVEKLISVITHTP